MKFHKLRGIATLFALVLLLPSNGYSQTSQGIWINASELASLPMSGAAWDKLKAQADASAGTPLLSNQDQMNNVYVLAKALVYARTGIERYRTEVIDQCMLAINTEIDGTTLALGRELAAYVIAADLVKLPSDKNEVFRAWLRRTLTEDLSGRTLQSTQEVRPNNWGTHAGASRAAVAAYLGDTAELARAAQVFRGWLGERSVYAGFSFGDLWWQCDPAKPVGINPPGCRKDGYSIDGVLPDDQRRSGGFTWPPLKENYVWEALQGALVTAEILHRAGYDAYNWSDKALLRAYLWLHDQANFPAAGDDQWQPHVVNYRYRATFPAPIPARAGKNMGWTDWTHGVGRAVSSPTPEPAPTPAPAPEPTPAPTYTTARVEQNNPAVSYSGTWYNNKNSMHSGGTAAQSMTAGSKAAFTFSGTAVTWIGLEDRWSGIANVYIDGTQVAEVDTYSSSTKARVALYSASGLPYGTHTFVVEATGRKRSGSGGRWIWVDAFEYTTAAQTSALEGPTATPVVRDATTVALADIGPLQVGYAPIRKSSDAPAPAGGLATFGFRQGSALVTEAAVPASRLTEAGRIYVEETGRISTGLALANPNDAVNTVQFFFSDLNGQAAASGSFELPARGQIARFSHEAPFNGRSSWIGTLTFTSTLPVVVTSVRTVINERADFIITTTAVADLTPYREDPVLIPHFAAGGGWANQIILINPIDSVITGTVEFIGQATPSLSYAIAPRAAATIQIPAVSEVVHTGAVRIVPDASNAAPVATSIFSFKMAGVTVTEASVSGVDTGRGFTLFAEKNSNLLKGTPGSTETGLAVVNAGPGTTLQFELLSEGQTLHTAQTAISANSHMALYLSQIPGFQAIADGFQGVLRITSSSSDVALMGMRSTLNERGELLVSSLPAVNDELIHPNSRYVFPHFAFGSGYATRFVVFDNPAGQPSSLEFYSSSGTTLTPPR